MRILFVTHLPWVATAGAVGQQVTLSEALADLGVRVAHISGTEMGYKRPANRVTNLLHNPPPAAKAIRATRRVASAYDVIEGHQSVLPVRSDELGLTGVLAMRSAGLMPIYDMYQQADRALHRHARPHMLTRAPRAFQRKRALSVARKSYERADIAIAVNEDEEAHLREVRGKRRVERMTSGLPGTKLAELGAATLSPEHRLAAKQVVFIGSWSRRKGAQDWPIIVRETWGFEPDVQFMFLGTGLSDEALSQQLDVGQHEVGYRIIHHPRFTPDELPDLVSSATVSVLPSYAEGYPIAVIEVAAAGIPTIAYDTVGTREFPRRIGGDWVVAAGDAHAMARRIAATIQMTPRELTGITETCRELALEHSWDYLAPMMLQIYEDMLDAR